jgi:hypothetical protein
VLLFILAKTIELLFVLSDEFGKYESGGRSLGMALHNPIGQISAVAKIDRVGRIISGQ